jgi:hypothetical protein
LPNNREKAVQQTNSPTWILFASGGWVKIELSLFEPPAERTRPIEAYIVSEAGPELFRSASRAVEAVYGTAYECSIPPAPTVVGYDLTGLANGCQITGASAGLALALALAKKLWPEYDPGPIAATGAIASGSSGGPLERIEGFESKARTALELLAEGDLFFYPEANQSDLTPNLETEFTKQGIRLCPVPSVAAALAHFMPPIAKQIHLAPPSPPEKLPQPDPEQRPIFMIILIVLLFSAGAALLFFNYATPKRFKMSATPKTLPASTKPLLPHEPKPESPNNRPANNEDTPPAASTKPENRQSPTLTPGSNPAPDKAEKPAAPEVQPTSAAPPAKTVANPGRNQEQTKNSPDTPGAHKTAPSLPAAEKKSGPRTPAVILKASTPWLGRLGERTQARLAARLDAEPTLKKEIQSLDGTLEIQRLSERRNPADDSLETTLTLTLRGHIRGSGSSHDRQSLEIPALTLKYPGPSTRLPDQSASELAEKIAQNLKKKLT